jgi:putative endonuclease
VNSSEAGRQGEERAKIFLESKGFQILENNYRTKGGEIDLVARDGEEIVFVEVRSRSRQDYGGAMASIDARKRRKIIFAARVWLQTHDWQGACRFDAVALEQGVCEHIPAAFTLDDR